MCYAPATNFGTLSYCAEVRVRYVDDSWKALMILISVPGDTNNTTVSEIQ
jgi:hypothetical protein